MAIYENPGFPVSKPGVSQSPILLHEASAAKGQITPKGKGLRARCEDILGVDAEKRGATLWQ